MTRFGLTTGASSLATTANRCHVSKVTVGGANITFRRGVVKLASSGIWPDTAKARLVIYDDTGGGGAPGALVAASHETTGCSFTGFVPFVFDADVTLNASTSYYLGIHTDTASISLAATASTGTNYYQSDTYSDGTAASFSGSTSTTQLCLWVEYGAEVAVLGSYDDRVMVAKGYAAAVLAQEAFLSVAKSYVAVVLEPTEPPPGNVIVVVAT